MTQAKDGHELATLAGGCFWCLEAVFDELKGVASVESGYMGDILQDPSYADVCGGDHPDTQRWCGTSHSIRLVVSFRRDSGSSVSSSSMNPTTRNRQGNDSGTQYRSAIFYHSPEQKATGRAGDSRAGLPPAYGTEPIVITSRSRPPANSISAEGGSTRSITSAIPTSRTA